MNDPTAMKKQILTLLCLTALALNARGQARKTLLDADWQYLYGTAAGAYAPDYDDSAWRTLNLPHDWSMETEAATAAGSSVGPFSQNSVGGRDMGYTVGGTAWYRKRFTLSDDALSGRVMLYFEGAYNYADVWLNGYKVYFNHYGYQSFRFDITDLLLPAGEENVLAVRVTNEGLNTRWYAGSGIYRHVWLLCAPNLHLDTWGTYITTPAVSETGATVSVLTTLVNETTAARDAEVSVTLLSPDGLAVGEATQTVTVPATEGEQLTFAFSVDAPALWSPDTPNRYSALLTATDPQAATTDTATIRFGIRSLSFSADEGFLLNGEPTLLQGGCVHHDNGLLGAAAIDAAENRKLSLLKAEGFNAVRASHNMVSEHYLDACDSIGLMVIDESFDQWLRAKNEDDYHQFFDEFSDRDLQTMVKRDRNHPSVIMWSLGNEIPGRILDTGIAAAARMRQTILRLDSTRPLTAAIPSWDDYSHSWADDSENAFLSLDVGGYNYLYGYYESDHADYPQRIMVGLESYPKRASENWVLAENNSYVIGDFVWTAMDYVGEAGIASASFLTSGSQASARYWPWFNGWCGDIDLIGQKKPQSYYRDVVWHRQPITMAAEEVPPSGTYQSISSWGWQREHQSWNIDCDEGTTVTVNVYSRAPYVRLYLNDELLGTAEPSSTFWAGFYIPYAPGTLRAVNYDGETESDAFELITTGEGVALRLTSDRSHINADGRDLAYITVELIDSLGQVVSDSTHQVSFLIEGEGELLCGGNACPYDQTSFRSLTPKLFEGRALAIAQSTTTSGAFTVTVLCDTLPSQSITITTGDYTEEDTETAISRVADQAGGRLRAVSLGGRILVSGADSYRVYNTAGQQLPTTGQFPTGVYIVRAGNQAVKVAVRG